MLHHSLVFNASPYVPAKVEKGDQAIRKLWRIIVAGEHSVEVCMIALKLAAASL